MKKLSEGRRQEGWRFRKRDGYVKKVKEKIKRTGRVREGRRD